MEEDDFDIDSVTGTTGIQRCIGGEVDTIATTDNSTKSATNYTRTNRKTKPHSPALQLLLTLIRSDWDQYEVRKQQLLLSSHQYLNKPKPSISFFPLSLTLNDMYQRIQPQPQHQQNTSNTFMPPPHRVGYSSGAISSDVSWCALTLLPFEILQRKIVQPYLDASTLAALRSTCRYMYESLRSIVPGLKLQLYHHQINSLHWMRQRETSRIRIESDCFVNQNVGSSSRIQDETGDIHRAVTGGASVKLFTNPSSISSLPSRIERPQEVIYLDPYTGIEILPNDISQLQELRRNVACGGLLCDDPGLGKTITVLALILQTPLVAPSPPSLQQHQQHPAISSPLTNGSSNHIDTTNNDEKLFEMYWSEEISSDFRAPYLLKLINEFCKKIPVTVGMHFPINELRKSIGEDRYASQFAQFDVAVQ